MVWYLDEEVSGCFPGLGGLTVRAQGEALSPAPPSEEEQPSFLLLSPRVSHRG